MRRVLLVPIAVAGFTAVAVLSGCGKHSKPNFTFMPDMWYSPALKAQEDGANRYPVAGTVPRGHQSYAYLKATAEEAGRKLKNPLKRTKDILARGKTMYDTHCIVCHGPAGEGDGTIVPKFPRPPSLHSDKVRQWQDGALFHVITAGQNLMPAYRAQVDTADRWAIIHYIRALQRSKNPTAEDLRVAEAR
jgi:mono/diheme cytochrome c family protein